MQPIAYFNSSYLPAEELRLPVSDTGFVWGVTIAEQLRTFAGQPFRVQQHLQRMQQGLSVLGLSHVMDQHDLATIVQHVVRHNRQFVDPDDDLGITLFATPGPYSTYAAEVDVQPTVAVHSYPLAFRLWWRRYETGQPLVQVNVQQVSARCWPAHIKCRSRMHYYLAARQARQQLADAAALLLDESGFVSETPIANVVAYFAGEGLVSPPQPKILPGISLQVLAELAREARIDFGYRDLHVEELSAAEEILLTSTPYCVLPVTQLNHALVGSGQAGPIYRQLLQRWGQQVGVDLAEQARRFATRVTSVKEPPSL